MLNYAALVGRLEFSVPFSNAKNTNAIHKITNIEIEEYFCNQDDASLPLDNDKWMEVWFRTKQYVSQSDMVGSNQLRDFLARTKQKVFGHVQPM